MQVDHGSFTPLVFSIYGGMGRECQIFYAKLAELIADKRNSNQSLISTWIRTKICFALQKSCLLCLRGSRSTNRNMANFEDDIEISRAVSKAKWTFYTEYELHL